MDEARARELATKFNTIIAGSLAAMTDAELLRVLDGKTVQPQVLEWVRQEIKRRGINTTKE